jgi:hypothetical protein
MAAMLAAFLLWLFATGEYAAWVALLSSAKARPVTPPGNTGGATGSWGEPTAPSAPQPTAMVRTGADWVNNMSGELMGDTSWANDA